MSPNPGFVWNHPLWWSPWLWLVVVWTCLFYPSWLAKDRSMSRYPAWALYTAQLSPVLEPLSLEPQLKQALDARFLSQIGPQGR